MKARLRSDFTWVVEVDDCWKQRKRPSEPLLAVMTGLKPTDAMIDEGGGDIALRSRIAAGSNLEIRQWRETTLLLMVVKPTTANGGGNQDEARSDPT